MKSVRTLIQEALIAALYVAMVGLFSATSFEAIQFRFAEALLVLVLYQRRHAWGLMIGTFLANFLSPLPVLIDVLVGTLASALAIGMMIVTKNKSLALIWPPLVNGVIIGFELTYVYGTPLLYNMVTVFIGEFVVVSLVGWLLIRLIDHQPRLKEVISR